MSEDDVMQANAEAKVENKMCEAVAAVLGCEWWTVTAECLSYPRVIARWNDTGTDTTSIDLIIATLNELASTECWVAPDWVHTKQDGRDFWFRPRSETFRDELR